MVDTTEHILMALTPDEISLLNTTNLNLTDIYSNQSHEDHDHPEWSYRIQFEFIVHGILLICIGVLGLLGNIVSIVILSRPQMKSSINTILIGLVSCDSLLIVTSVFLFSFTVFRHTGYAFFSFFYWEIYPYVLPVLYPIGLIAQTGSAYLTLGVTIERYLVVCWPLKARSICTNGRAKLAVMAFSTFAVIYNIPRFFEVTWKTDYIVELGENKTVFVPTDMRKDSLYVSIYVTWMYLVFMYIVPFASLAALNLLIFLEIRKANTTRSMLSNQEKKEHNLAVMLLVVVFVFFICNILPLIVNILELFAIQNQQLIQVSNLLVTINSSVNILIYCIFGNKFKTLFMQIFCGRKPHIQTVRTGLELRRGIERSQFDSASCRSSTNNGHLRIISSKTTKTNKMLLSPIKKRQDSGSSSVNFGTNSRGVTDFELIEYHDANHLRSSNGSLRSRYEEESQRPSIHAPKRSKSAYCNTRMMLA